MGWQKRGRAHNSLSGVGAAIGVRSGKVVAYATRNKRCSTCHTADLQGKAAKDHDCRKNFHKSAKAMEASVAVEVTASINESGKAKVAQLVGDDDSSTIARVRELVDGDIQKLSDITHAKRSLGNHLYDLKKEHKELSDKVIGYLQKMFGYAVKQNQNDADGIERALQSIVPHAYGDHSQCGSWCGYLKDPMAYKHAGLPHGRDLSNQSTRQALAEEFNLWASQAEKLAPMGSSQVNESFNNTVCSKAPKSSHFSSSESNDFRVGCAVAQKNMGHTYVCQVYEEMGLSPGESCKQHGERLDKARSRIRNLKGTKKFKARRTLLKEMRRSTDRSAEVREGTTYSSGCGHKDIPEEELKEIPPITTPVKESPVGVTKNAMVFFDVETTGLSPQSEIVQLAAFGPGEEQFQTYVLPERDISQGATKVTGLSVRRVGGCRCLYHHEEKVKAVSESEALSKFVAWLCEISSHKVGKLVLVAHNASVFDNRILLNALERNSAFDTLNDVVSGFADTLLAFRSQFPDLKGKCNLGDLSRHFGEEPFQAHDAMEDVRALRAICSKHVPVAVLARNSITLLDAKKKNERQLKSADLLATYSEVIHNKVLTRGTAAKAANSGLAWGHIVLSFTRNGRDGVVQLLSEKTGVGRSVRVTNCRRILDSIAKHLESQ